MDNFYIALGIISGLLIVIADIPYAIDSLKGKTKPHRITWGTICLLNIIAIANQSASGARGSVGFFVGAAFATFLIFLISIFKGTGGYAKLDIACLAGVIIGLWLWYIFDSPSASIYANFIVATFAMLPTIQKAYKYPQTETKITWILGAISAAFAVWAVNSSNLILYLLPVYSVLVQLFIYTILTVRVSKNYQKSNSIE